MEWLVLTDFHAILEVSDSLDEQVGLYLYINSQQAHHVLEVMSNEGNPIMSATIGIFEMLMSNWEKMATEHSRVAPFINEGLKWAIGYYGKTDQTMAYVVSMC